MARVEQHRAGDARGSRGGGAQRQVAAERVPGQQRRPVRRDMRDQVDQVVDDPVEPRAGVPALAARAVPRARVRDHRVVPGEAACHPLPVLRRGQQPVLEHDRRAVAGPAAAVGELRAGARRQAVLVSAPVHDLAAAPALRRDGGAERARRQAGGDLRQRVVAARDDAAALVLALARARRVEHGGVHRHERPHEAAEPHDPRVPDVEPGGGREHRSGGPALAQEDGREQALHGEHARAHRPGDLRMALEEAPRPAVAVRERARDALERLAVAPRGPGELGPARDAVGQDALQRDRPQRGVDEPRVAPAGARQRGGALDQERDLVGAVRPVVVARVQGERRSRERRVGGQPRTVRQRRPQRERRRHAQRVQRGGRAAVRDHVEHPGEPGRRGVERTAADVPVVEASAAAVAGAGEVLEAGDEMRDRRDPLHARQRRGAVRRLRRHDVAHERRQGFHDHGGYGRRAASWAGLPPAGEHLHPNR